MSKMKLLSLAVAACLAAPAAFAQSQPESKPVTAAATAEPATPAVPAVKADAAVGVEAQAAIPAIPATPARKNWSELDANGNGSLSVGEAEPMQGLSKVFAKADADADGELTQDEYKAWLAANGKAKGKAKAGG